MKILKPGKVEQRKFVCQECGCIFVARKANIEQDIHGGWVMCPYDGCGNFMEWKSGEPYEEPVQDTQTEKERLYGILLIANPNATTTELTDHLIANGVTFRED